MLVRDKIEYTAVEINARLSDNEELSLPVANTIVVLDTLTKDDLVKVEKMYSDKYHVNLLDQLDVSLGRLPPQLPHFYICLRPGQSVLCCSKFYPPRQD